MPNTLLTPSIIAKEALLRLRKVAVLPQLVHRDYSAEFVGKVGDTITVRKPATFVAKEFDTEITVQDGTEGSVPVKMDKHLDVSFAVTSKEMALSVESFGDQFLQPAMEAFSGKIADYIAALYADIPYVAPVSATPAFTDLKGPLAIMNGLNVPLADRRLVMGAVTQADFVIMDQFVNAEKAGTTEALRKANMGPILGFDTYMDNHVAAHTKGTLGTSKVQTGVALGALTGSFYNTSLTGTLKVGDTFTVAGDVQTYVVTKAATAASNAVSVEFYPAAKAAWAADAAVTLNGNATENLAFHKNAFALVTRQLEIPQGAANAAIVNFDGFAIRVVYDYDLVHKKDVVSLDMLCGVKTLTPELAVRFRQ